MTPIPKSTFLVRVVPYEPQWPSLFELERGRLQAFISGGISNDSFAIEHIGSTSVPGLSAKPVIDIAIRFRDFKTVRGQLTQWLPAEYFPLINRNEGVGRMLFGQSAPLAVRLHLYDWNSPLWLAHTHFRDYLRKDAQARALYAAVKRTAAARHPRDSRAYHRCKNQMIDRLQSLALKDAGFADPAGLLSEAALTYGGGGDGGTGGDTGDTGDPGDTGSQDGDGDGDGGDAGDGGGDPGTSTDTVVVEIPNGYRVYWNGGDGWEPEHGGLLSERYPDRVNPLDPYAINWYSDGDGGEWRATYYLDPVTNQPIVEWEHLPKGYV
jgi:GrpB-like predicted nucleotidyltransferase (UPF0157 family)